ncbi:MAG TPA: hypothetical protein VE307_05350 [Nitrososphaeraceae archaeon]|nr:hypothetical protein [Nitrososphaeraceae archaeon]
MSKSMKSIARISTMGEKKVVIYVPQEYHKDILQNFKGKALKITIEEAI